MSFYIMGLPRASPPMNSLNGGEGQRMFAGKIKPEVGESSLGLGIIIFHDLARKNNAALYLMGQVGVWSCI